MGKTSSANPVKLWPNRWSQPIVLKNNSFCCFLHLQLSNYCSFEGVLYCRPHYDQLFKRTGSLDKSFEGKCMFFSKSNKFHAPALSYYSIQLFCSLNILSGTPKILKPEKHLDEVSSQETICSSYSFRKELELLFDRIKFTNFCMAKIKNKKSTTTCC